MKSIRLFTLLSLVALMQGCYKEPIANFEYSYVDKKAPAEVTFINSSSEADKFQWDFGDGSTSAEKNPINTFYNYVSPSVSLVAKGRGGEDRITKNLGITSYFVRNSSGYTLYNLWVFYYDTDADLIQDDFDLGNLSSGYDSDVVITNHTVIDVAFESSDGTMYLVEYSYNLNENASSYLNITNETSVLDVSSTAKSTLSQPDFQKFRENGRRILLKELMAP